MATYTQIKEITFWLSFYLTHQAHQSADFFLYLDQIKKMIGILLMSMFMVLHSGKSPFIFYGFFASMTKYCFKYMHLEI